MPFYNYSVSSDPNIYNAQLQGYNEILTEGVVKAKSELSFQFEQNSNAVIASEAYAENILSLKRVLNGIERGQKAINFDGVNVRKVFPPSGDKNIMALFFVLGGFLGCSIVMLRYLISRRRNSVG